MTFDYSIHSSFIIHWTGKDIDDKYDKSWKDSDRGKSETNTECTEAYIKRLGDILKYGLWMTEEKKNDLFFNKGNFRRTIPKISQTCFTELKLSESRKHARQYGRLGIGFKRSFVFDRFGRPLVYYGRHENRKNDKFLEACARELKNADLLNFFKPMNSMQNNKLDYDWYAECEWRIIYFKALLKKGLIIDPRNTENQEVISYYLSLTPEKKLKLKFLIPLDGWLSMIIYPSLNVKNRAQRDTSNGIINEITRIKGIKDRGNRVEGRNWPIELDLDACRNF